jgi:hypothetical protein
MKQTLITMGLILLGAIAIVGIEEYHTHSMNKQASLRKTYVLDNGVQFRGTNEEAIRLKEAIKNERNK